MGSVVLQKPPYILIKEHEEIQRVLSRKLTPYCLALIILEFGVGASGNENVPSTFTQLGNPSTNVIWG